MPCGSQDRYFRAAKQMHRGGVVGEDHEKAEGTKRTGSVMFSRGGELPEPKGEETEHTMCPKCGHRFALGGEIPEPEGEEMGPENMTDERDAGPFSRALSKLRPGVYETTSMAGPRKRA